MKKEVIEEMRTGGNGKDARKEGYEQRGKRGMRRRSERTETVRWQ